MLRGPVEAGHMRGLGHGKAALALCLFGLSQSGCDIVQGFVDAGDAVFPDEKNYFDAPGFRLVAGGYRDLEFASGKSLHLLARPVEADDFSLYMMEYADPRPCVLPNIKSHRVGIGVFLDATTISYTEEGTDHGTLRFADGNCHTYDVRIEQSALPLVETPEGFVVSKAGDIVMVNPVSGVQREIASDASYAGYFSGFYVLYSKGRGQIAAFKTDWQLVRWVGNGVVKIGGAGSSFFYEDSGGIHRLTAAGADSITDTVIASTGCKLGFARNIGSSENWVHYHSPCDTKKFIVYSESASKASELDLEANPDFIAYLPAHPHQSGDPAVDPFFIFYLTEVNANAWMGQLMMRTPTRQTKVLGQRAAWERLSAFAGPTETHGFALVDVEGDIGSFVRWDNSDRPPDVLATGVVRSNGDLVTNFDGETGQFELLSESGLSVVSRRVPSHGFKSRDAKGRWTAFIDDYYDKIGTLRISKSSLDFTEAARTPAPPPASDPIAWNVLWDSRARFVPAVPGIAYLTNYDRVNDVGRLDYRNLELQFTATISDGVAAYLETPGGLIYSVPFGDGAGIWVLRSR
jgi:hypothetical protein